MLEQERYLTNLDADLASSDDRLHPLYREIHTQDGTVLYFNKFAGYLGRIPYGTLPLNFTFCDNAYRTAPQLLYYDS
jgi:hypothetical protein